MRIKNISKLITKHGNTTDIIKTVMMAYDVDNDPQIEELAELLKGSTEIETCKNIWEYLIYTVYYKADNGKQVIKTPARMFYDGFADCKSYSVFTGVALRYLGIPHFFRFASYDSRKEATHVYVVAVIDGKEIPIDAVAFIQLRLPFGKQEPYTYYVDMKDRTTEIVYISGLGDRYAIGQLNTYEYVQAYLNSGIFDVWLDNENPETLTLAKGYLMSEWDKEWTNYAVAQNNDERITALNRLQYIAVMISLYNEYYKDNEILFRIGKVMAFLINTGRFSSDEINPDNRDFFSDSNINIANELLDNSDDLDIYPDFLQVWKENVIDENRLYLDDNKQPMSIGAVNNLHSDFEKTGSFYLYHFIPDSEQNKYGSKVYRKRLIQNQQYGYNEKYVKNLSKATQANLIYSGATKTYGVTPQNYIKAITNGTAKVNGIGIGVVDPVTLTAIISGIVSIILAIIALFTKDKPLSDSTLLANAPADGDIAASVFAGNPNNSEEKAGISWLLPVALVGGLLFSKMKKNNK